MDCHARLDITDRNGETVFHYAVRGGSPEIIEVSGRRSSLGGGLVEEGSGKEPSPALIWKRGEAG